MYLFFPPTSCCNQEINIYSVKMCVVFVVINEEDDHLYLKSKRTSLVLLTSMEGATTLRCIPARNRRIIVMLVVEKNGCSHIEARNDTCSTTPSVTGQMSSVLCSDKLFYSLLFYLGALKREHSSIELRVIWTNVHMVDSYFLHLTMHT